MAVQVVDGKVEQLSIVTELPESAVAVETQQSSYGTRRVVMVDVFGRALPTDYAEPTLRYQHLACIVGGDPVSPLQMKRASATYLFPETPSRERCGTACNSYDVPRVWLV